MTLRINSSAAHIVVVVLTGHDVPQHRQAAFGSGADCFPYKGATAWMNDVLARVDGTR